MQQIIIAYLYELGTLSKFEKDKEIEENISDRRAHLLILTEDTLLNLGKCDSFNTHDS